MKQTLFESMVVIAQLTLRPNNTFQRCDRRLVMFGARIHDSERQLEQALLSRIEHFLQEMGAPLPFWAASIEWRSRRKSILAICCSIIVV